MDKPESHGEVETVRASTIPKPVGCDVMKLSLDRRQAYVLSLVDGRSSVDDLATLAGLTFEDARAAVLALAALGAVQLPDATPRRRTKAPPPRRSTRSIPRARRPSQAKLEAAAAFAPESVPRRLPVASSALAMTASDGFVLSQIDGSTRVGELASIVGTTPEALAEVLRRLLAAGAIDFSASKLDDGRRLARRGDAVAIDVFSTPRTRQRTNPGLRPTRAPTDEQMPPPSARTRPPSKKTAPPPKRTTSLPPPRAAKRTAPPPPKRVSALPPKSSTPAPRSPSPPMRPSARAMRRVTPSNPPVPPAAASPDPMVSRRPRVRITSGRMGAVTATTRGKASVARTVAPPKRASAPAAGPENADVVGQDAAARAPGLFPERDPNDGRQHARIFVEAAERELASGNVVAAAAQFKLALSCCKAPEIQSAFEAVEAMAIERRFELQKAAGEAAEKDERWADAAAAYGRAHATRTDATVCERLANALRRSAGDLRAAARAAEEAVRQDPTNPRYHVTLAEVYTDAGLELRAQAEVRRALELCPDDTRAQALAAKLRR
jgi:hypothetical protein